MISKQRRPSVGRSETPAPEMSFLNGINRVLRFYVSGTHFYNVTIVSGEAKTNLERVLCLINYKLRFLVSIIFNKSASFLKLISFFHINHGNKLVIRDSG